MSLANFFLVSEPNPVVALSSPSPHPSSPRSHTLPCLRQYPRSSSTAGDTPNPVSYEHFWNVPSEHEPATL
jgi:hypothetical protein